MEFELLKGVREMKVTIKGKEIEIDKGFFVNDSLGMAITALATTMLLGPIIGMGVAAYLIIRMVKKDFKK